jgi:predicted metal-dependent peptidase
MAVKKQDVPQLTPKQIEERVDEVKLLVDKVTSKLLREERFLPFMPELLTYEIIFTNALPAPAGIWEEGEKLFVNPMHPVYKQFEEESLMSFVMLHEVLHVLLKHAARLVHREREMWNMATDYVINLLLQAISREESSSSIMRNCTNYNYEEVFLIDKKFENKLEEEVYDILSKNNNMQKKIYQIPMSQFMQGMGQSGGQGDQKQQGQGQSQDGTGEDGDEMVEVTETTMTVNGKKIKHTDIKFPERKYGSEKEKAEAESSRKQRVGMSRQLLESSLTKGSGAESLKEFLKRLFDVKVDWTKILADSIMTELEKSTVFTWGRPRMTWLSNPYVLPYLPNQDDEEKYGTVVFSIDESGSMSSDDVRKAASVIKQASDYYKNIYVIKHDDGVSWKKLYNKDELNIDEILVRRRCGGTSHRQVFEEVMNFLKSTPEGMVSCFIACTDMESDIEDCQHLMDKNIPRIYLTNHDSNNGRNRHKNVLGRVIFLK